MSVYVEHKTCGCGVDGIGTLEHPYKMRLCAEHESAPRLRDLLRTVEELIRYVERNECQHEDTYRGGSIWTICRECGRKWADDQGGFKPYEEPKEISAARSALLALARGEESEGGK